jgi:hypothetical protein
LREHLLKGDGKAKLHQKFRTQRGHGRMFRFKTAADGRSSAPFIL